jgi:hypothetical protein
MMAFPISYGWVFLIALWLLFTIGFLLPALPYLLVLGRVMSVRKAIALVDAGKGVITYHTDMGLLHRVWWSPVRPVTGHFRALSEGFLVWAPFWSWKHAKEQFGDRMITTGPGWRWDCKCDDGSTLFEFYWKDIGRKKDGDSIERDSQKNSSERFTAERGDL